MPELYGSRGNRNARLSQREIQEMKKNMQKVPLIQIKSEIQQKRDREKAEMLLDEIEDTKINTDIKNSEVKNEESWLAKLLKKLLYIINKN